MLECVAKPSPLEGPRGRFLQKLPGVFVSEAAIALNGKFVDITFMHNCPALHHKFHCPHVERKTRGGRGKEEDFQRQETGWRSRRKRKEDNEEVDDDVGECLRELPKAFVQAYAEVVHHVFQELEGKLCPREPGLQRVWLQHQLRSATDRLAEEHVIKNVVAEIVTMLEGMQAGQETAHLEALLRRIDHRGSDVQLWCGELDKASRQLAPYPAFRWEWRTVAAYGWKVPQHISVLEVVAFLNHIIEASQHKRFINKRFFHVVDSQVAAAVITKGRSSSRALNIQLRKVAGILLVGNLYPLVVWTLSGWNYADGPSRARPPGTWSSQ